MRTLSLLFISVTLLACSEPANQNGTEPPIAVRAITPSANGVWTQTYSGEVRARYESTLAFEVPGRIAERVVNAGAQVSQGQVLLTLDSVNLTAQLTAANAQLAAAQAELNNAQTEYARIKATAAQQLSSEQLLDQALLRLNTARQQVAAQQANLTNAQEALNDASLTAPADGVVIEFATEQGQVVNAGTPALSFAYADTLEVEVLLPAIALQDTNYQQAQLVPAGIPLTLREQAGALTESGRMLRSRFQAEQPIKLPLNAVVQVQFGQITSTYAVPLSALDARCSLEATAACTNAQVWQITSDNKVSPIPVAVVRLENEYAYVQGALDDNTRIVQAGTHKLVPNMMVRVLPE